MRPKIMQHRKILGATAILAGILVGFFGFIAVAQTPDGQASPAQALIGASVYSAEGSEVGTVAAVTEIGRAHV